MNSSNPIVTNNVRVWRADHGFTARENEVKRILDERSAHEKQVAEETAECNARLDKARRCGAKVPVNAIDVVFRRGAQGDGGRLRWSFVLAPTKESLVLV
jgi:hypothetical protein